MSRFGVDDGTSKLLEGALGKISGTFEAGGVTELLEVGTKHLKDILTRCSLMF